MASLPRPGCAPQARRAPPPPRPPRSWSFDPATSELTVTDCDGVREVYHVSRLRSDFGPHAFELVVVGSARFGLYHHVLFDDSGAWNCSCPGGTFANPRADGHRCKHTHAVAALLAEGVTL